MKVVIFGASGRVGSLLVEGALKRGHQVTAYTRNALNVRIKHKNLKVCGGTVSDDNPVREAIAGQQQVLVALGAKDISRPHSVCQDGTKRIIAAMQLHNVKRVVMLCNLGLLPLPDGQMMGDVKLPPFLDFIFADQRNAYNLLKDSDRDWVVVCPPFMPKGTQTGKYRVAVEESLERAQSISVEDAAHFMLKEAFDEPHHNVRVGISY